MNNNYTELSDDAEVTSSIHLTHEDEYVRASEIREMWSRAEKARNTINVLLSILCGLQVALLIKEIFL